jgi:hypothetical protein
MTFTGFINLNHQVTSALKAFDSPSDTNRQRDHACRNPPSIGIVVSRFGKKLSTSPGELDVKPSTQAAAYPASRYISDYLV